jgi:integrase
MPRRDLFRPSRTPWNAGRLIGPKPPLKAKHIWAIREQLRAADNLRDLALFNCAIDAKLRGCDLVKLRVSDVPPSGEIRQRATVIQKKTGQPVPFELTAPTREALTAWLAIRGVRADDWLFPSRNKPGEHMTTRQYARLVDRWTAMIDLEAGAYGTHSLRRTKVALVYKRTGNLRACQLLLGHRKLESTVRYLGIEVDDALAMSEQTEI